MTHSLLPREDPSPPRTTPRQGLSEETPPTPWQPAPPQNIPIEVAQPKPRRRWLSSWTMLLLLLAGAFFTLLWGRQWLDSVLARLDYQKPVHHDQTEVNTGIQPRVPNLVQLVYQEVDGRVVRVLADAEAYTGFVRERVARLEIARAETKAMARARLDTELTKVFTGLRQRVGRFADWYFAYPTTYKLMGAALSSTAQHATSLEAQSLADAVARDVELYLQQRYEAIVLRPEVTDPLIRQVFTEALTTAQTEYRRELASMHQEFQQLIARHAVQPGAASQAEIHLDWRGQFHKFSVAEYDKSPASFSAALTLGGGIAGKAIGGAAAKGAVAKLASPFVTKAAAASGGGLIGALGGPVGALIGVGVGLGVDYLINEGLELMQRDHFVADVNQALSVTQMEWEQHLAAGLDQGVNAWYDDTMNLLPRFRPDRD